MILTAFSHVLQRDWHRYGRSAKAVLHAWLLATLTEAHPQDNVGRVIHAELKLLYLNGRTAFAPRHASGQILLHSLFNYCESYEQWQFRRWLHEAQPQTFRSQSTN